MNLNAHMYKYHNYPRLSLPFPLSFLLIPHFAYFAIKFYLFISYLLDAISSVFLSPVL